MINTVKPDEMCVMAYVSSYYHAFSGAQQVRQSVYDNFCVGRDFIRWKKYIPIDSRQIVAPDGWRLVDWQNL